MTGPTPKEPNSVQTEEKKEGQVKPEALKLNRGVIHFLTENKWEIVSYFLLFIGLLLAFSSQLFGGLLVGLILGIYFSQEVCQKAASFKDFIDKEGIFRGFIVVAAVLALLILASGLLIGTAIGAWLRPFLGKAISSPFDKDETQK